jgi:hypothetical protein
MRGRFFKRKYGQRWQAESGFSRHKRRLGSALTTRNDTTQRREMLLRVPTHNLMILRRNPSRISTEHLVIPVILEALKMNEVVKIPLVLTPQPESGYTVTSSLLPELVTEGDTVEDALENVSDARLAVIGGRA